MEPRVLPFATIDAAETEGVDAFCFGMDERLAPIQREPKLARHGYAAGMMQPR